MALLTKQPIQATGTQATYAAAAAGGDTVRPDARGTVLHVLNGHTASQTVTVVIPGAKFGQPLADVAVAVPAGEDRFVLLTREMADTDGLVSLTYSGVTALTVAALSA